MCLTICQACHIGKHSHRILVTIPYSSLNYNEGSEVVSVTNQLKLLAPDGKRRLTDVLDYDGVVLLGKSFPNTRASRFVEWFTNSVETIDGKSKSKVCNRYTVTFSAVSTTSPARSAQRPSA